jgi:hypothetical protein
MPRPKVQSTSPSPLPKTDQTPMDFPSAIARIIAGDKITKIEWNNPEYYGVLEGGFLMLHKPDGKLYQWIVSDGDIMGEDWIVI